VFRRLHDDDSPLLLCLTWSEEHDEGLDRKQFVLKEAHTDVIDVRFVSCVYLLNLSSARQHPSYGNCLQVKSEYYQNSREYCQNSSVLDSVTQCSQSAAHLCEQFLQLKQIGFVTLGPLRCA